MQIEKSDLLAVDLDGSLIKTDMLHETFWAALVRKKFNIIKFIISITRGRLAIKKFLSDAPVSYETLPYNQEVIDLVNRHRCNGGRAIMVTASHELVANKINDQLGIFDAVHGSCDECNLKGVQKLRFLKAKYPSATICYLGDSTSDIKVWQGCDKVVTIDVPYRLKRQVDQLEKPTLHLNSGAHSLAATVRAMRPHQWVKNILLFMPIMAAHDFSIEIITQCLLGFFAFSMIASSVYLTNDLVDLSSDRQHSNKKFRPMASGQAQLHHATLLSVILMLLGFAIANMVSSSFTFVLGIYFVITILYSFVLKKIVVLDVCVLALLYTLRVVAGAAAAQLSVSVWLLAFSMFLFFALASIKRQAELVGATYDHKSNVMGRGYTAADLPVVTTMGLASGYLSILVLALYINSSEVSSLYESPEYLWGCCCILMYWLTRMVILAQRNEMHDDPIIFAAKDSHSISCIVGIILIALIGSFI